MKKRIFIIIWIVILIDTFILGGIKLYSGHIQDKATKSISESKWELRKIRFEYQHPDWTLERRIYFHGKDTTVTFHRKNKIGEYTNLILIFMRNAN